MKQVAAAAAAAAAALLLVAAAAVAETAELKKCFPSPSGTTCTSPSPLTSIGHLAPGGTMVTSSPQQEVITCFERIGTGTYNSMAPHPDGSARVFLSQEGKIFLASVPARGRSQGTLQINDDSPFLDLTHRVLGLVGIAFHPEFTTNGRFFVSYTCDCHSRITPICDAGCCSPAAGTGNGSMPSQYQLVVAEFSTSRGGDNDYSKETHADPAKVRRLFSMGLHQKPHTSHNQHGGQILFRPTNEYDGYLYLVAGHGGERNLSANNTSYHGKLIRFDVDNATPRKPEIFAVGLDDPRGCSFNPQRPSNLYCANVDQQQYQRVYSISNLTPTYGGSTPNIFSHVVIDHGRPTAGSASSIVGGPFYRGLADPSMNGRYLYMYGSAARSAMVEETPESDHLPYATSPIPNVCCSGSSPCSVGATAISGVVLFLGEDNNKDPFVLTTKGVDRLVKRGHSSVPPPQASSSQSPHWWRPWTTTLGKILLGIITALLATFVGWILKRCWEREGAGGETPAPQPQLVVINNLFQVQMASIDGIASTNEA